MWDQHNCRISCYYFFGHRRVQPCRQENKQRLSAGILQSNCHSIYFKRSGRSHESCNKVVCPEFQAQSHLNRAAQLYCDIQSIQKFSSILWVLNRTARKSFFHHESEGHFPLGTQKIRVVANSPLRVTITKYTSHKVTNSLTQPTPHSVNSSTPEITSQGTRTTDGWAVHQKEKNIFQQTSTLLSLAWCLRGARGYKAHLSY